TVDGVTLPSYRGDMVNAPEFTAAARMPDPRRRMKAHARSALTMNCVRALIDGGFADLHRPAYWDLSWVGHSPHAKDDLRIVESVADSYYYIDTQSGQPVNHPRRVDFYNPHEAQQHPY